jgi:hypothetical protein
MNSIVEVGCWGLNSPGKAAGAGRGAELARMKNRDGQRSGPSDDYCPQLNGEHQSRNWWVGVEIAQAAPRKLAEGAEVGDGEKKEKSGILQGRAGRFDLVVGRGHVWPGGQAANENSALAIFT